MLRLYLSNRPQALAASLAALLRADPSPLLHTEHVVAPSSAVARWLQLQLADALGVAARIEFPFAAAFAWRLFSLLLPDVATTNPFHRSAMQWRLLRLLKQRPAASVRAFLDGDDGARAHELATRLAVLFERYMLQRPEWTAAWSAGQHLGLGADEIWQAQLWRALAAELAPAADAAHPRQRFFDRLAADDDARRRLPRRLCLFAVESMPDLYWRVFADLAQWLDVHVFVLAPSSEYWGDIERLRRRLRAELEQPQLAALYEEGNALLASLGRGRRYAAARLAEAAAGVDFTLFAPPPPTLLGALQGDLLELRHSTAVALDDSVQIHSCHGPLREAEVLHDRLLQMFELLPQLQPADILILTPDIAAYGPTIAAVLQHAPPSRRIACVVADQAPGAAPPWRALRRLCETAVGELDAESVLALLEEAPLRNAFDLEQDDLPLLRTWTQAAAVCWGVDGASRARRGLPADDAHGWRAGVRRLLLGVALPEGRSRLFEGRLPAAAAEGARAQLLGRFIDFLEALFALGEQAALLHAPQRWSQLLLTTLERCLRVDEAMQASAQILREALANLGEEAAAAACETPLPLAAVLREVEALLGDNVTAHGFGGGAAVIASLQPGRPLPARVICLVGVNDGALPRPGGAPGFDLLARWPRAGDRDRRGEERYAFLETIICAGDALLITFSGRDPRSDMEQPPAAPLAELIDRIAAMSGCSPGEVVAQQPLQPFSTANFNAADERVFSYDEENLAVAATPPPTPFMTPSPASPPASAVALRRIGLQRLLDMFANPARCYAQERLGVRFAAGDKQLAGVEPFVPDALEKYHLRAACFAALREGADAATAQRLLTASGQLPQGAAGEIFFAASWAQAQRLAAAAAPWLTAAATPGCDVSYDNGEIGVSGRLANVAANGAWRVLFGVAHGRDRLRLWIEHLLLQLTAPAGVEPCSALVSVDGVMRLPPTPAAAQHVDVLLDLYRRGLQQPLPFYPETAWAWINNESDWRRRWSGDSYRQIPGEGDDPHVALLLRDSEEDPLGEAFRDMAQCIYEPLRAAMQVAGETDRGEAGRGEGGR